MTGLSVLLRATPWRIILGLSMAGAVLGALGIALAAPAGDGVGQRMLQLSLVVLGTSAACALEEPAAQVVSACPLSRGRQLGVKAVAAAPPLLAGSALVLVWWARTVPDRTLMLELTGTWVLGFSVALLARAWLDSPAEVVAPGLSLLLATLAFMNPLDRWVELFPLGPGLRTVPTWWGIVAISVVTTALAARERPWRRLTLAR